MQQTRGSPVHSFDVKQRIFRWLKCVEPVVCSIIREVLHLGSLVHDVAPYAQNPVNGRVDGSCSTLGGSTSRTLPSNLKSHAAIGGWHHNVWPATASRLPSRKCRPNALRAGLYSEKPYQSWAQVNLSNATKEAMSVCLCKSS